MKDFYIRITATNQKELDMRIQDNISRGFELVKVGKPEESSYNDSHYITDTSGYKKMRKGAGVTCITKIVAVMVRRKGV